MDVQTIVIPKEQALEQLGHYRGLQVNKRRDEDTYFRKLYRMAAQYPLLDVAQALKQTGVNEKNQPRLALAKATWTTVWFNAYERIFSPVRGYSRYKRDRIALPVDTYSWPVFREWHGADLSSAVPFVPPDLRPEDALDNYHILFEVKEWKEYPSDPFLLKNVYGWLYAVVGEWDLSPLETTLLSALRKA